MASEIFLAGFASGSRFADTDDSFDPNDWLGTRVSSRYGPNNLGLNRTLRPEIGVSALGLPRETAHDAVMLVGRDSPRLASLHLFYESLGCPSTPSPFSA